MDAFNAFLGAVRPVTEFLYFLASIGLAAFAYLGLQQIAILKSTAATQAKREALRLTSEQCAIYLDKVIPLQNAFHAQVKALKVTWFQGWVTEIRGNEIRVHRDTPANPHNFRELAKHMGYLNQMEAFSVYFVSRLANERVAYRTIGKTFVNHIDEVIPWVLMCREDGYFQHLASLYVVWKARAEAEKLALEQNKLAENLSNLRAMSSTAEPIGSYDE